MSSLSDLLVSYKQVHVPSYLQEEQEPIVDEQDNLIDPALIERVQNREKAQELDYRPRWKTPIQESKENTTMAEQSKGSTSFEAAMNSYLAKHPEDASYRQTLTKIAEKESGFKSNAKNSHSSASGYFQFIDSTRKQYSNVSKEQFLNDPEEQISAAVKLLKANRKISSKFSNVRGLSQLQVDYGMWFSPKALTNYLKTGTSNFKDPQGTSLMTVLNKMA